jgi:hypothetical protein
MRRREREEREEMTSVGVADNAKGNGLQEYVAC